eukprot:15048555-Alexandrium_andersonii.AAC.1
MARFGPSSMSERWPRAPLSRLHLPLCLRPPLPRGAVLVWLRRRARDRARGRLREDHWSLERDLGARMGRAA